VCGGLRKGSERGWQRVGGRGRARATREKNYFCFAFVAFVKRLLLLFMANASSFALFPYLFHSFFSI